MTQDANRALYYVIVILVADSYHHPPALGYKGLYWQVHIGRYSDTLVHQEENIAELVQHVPGIFT